jgi:broad specificity phosphatase PhoE
VIVSHGDFINLLIQELLDVGSAESRFPLPNSGTSLFEIHRRAVCRRQTCPPALPGWPQPSARAPADGPSGWQVITRWIGRVGHLAPAENYIQSYFRSGSG